MTPVNYDPVMARTHLLVPKDMKCHKCGAEEPWKDPHRKDVAAALAEQERLNDPKTWEGIGYEPEPAPQERELAGMREVLERAAKVGHTTAFEYLNMYREQRAYSWHDVEDALSKASDAIRALAETELSKIRSAK